ncbi:MAG TPA: MFS transporter [Stellaceae bacterium]|jgi:SHS family lactate transporter-like MFS transporter|nr:MFS transporter [Stellaceae bacterium]
MAVAADVTNPIPWWKEPTKDQWLAWVAAWLGWMLDAFDFTIFLLIMVPIAKEFDVPLVDVTFVFTLTLWLRLVGATASGWLADRVGRKLPLMISILWYSICNFIAGFSPTFWFLFLFRALLGIGMGAEWPAGAALAMESWPARSRGFMSGVLQGSWGLGFLLSSAAYGLLFESIGWRGLLWMGVLPALVVLYIRKFVKEPEVWQQNRDKQRQQKQEFRLPLFEIFRLRVLPNTLTACLWMGSGFVAYYTIFGLFATHLQKDLHFGPGDVALPLALSNTMLFVSNCIWGWVSDKIGRRWAMIIPAAIGILVTPFYLGFFTTSYSVLVIAFIVQGFFAGAVYGQNPSYLNERFPTEVRATAAGFCYHQGAIWGGLVGPLLAAWAATEPLGFAMPMLIVTVVSEVVFIIALLMGPETKGKVLVSDIELAHAPAAGD